MIINVAAIEKWLKDNDRSASWLGRRADIGAMTMKRVMKGLNCNVVTIVAIARVTGLCPNDLILIPKENRAA